MYTYIDFETNKLVASEEELLENENLIEMDENIAEAICKLNDLGYKTSDCCEGHYVTEPSADLTEIFEQNANIIFNYASAPYIQFCDGIKLPSIPNGWVKDVFDNSVDENNNEIYGYWECIRGVESEKSNQSPSQFYKNKLNELISLYEWIETLK